MLTNFFTIVVLFLDFVLDGPQLPNISLRALPECSHQVRLVVVWIFPELPIENMPLLLITRLLPVLSDYVQQDRSFYFALQRLICVLIEPLDHPISLGLLILKGDFLKAIDYALKLLLS